MKKHLLYILLALPLIAGAAPGNTQSKKSDDDFGDKFFSKSPELTAPEKVGVEISRKWQNTTEFSAPLPGPDGAIRFLFGATLPSIVCAPFKPCDVELQAGEQVIDINVGDLRFTIEPAVTVTNEGEIQHLLIRPLDAGLSAALIVTTNRRTYHLGLRSHREEYMARVVFAYPEDAMKKWAALRAKNEQARQEKVIPETGENLGDLNFNYTISGNTSWKPLRVYNDGRRTIIQMPATLSQGEAPTLLVLRAAGGLLSDDETGMVNYKLQGDRFIVDNLFEKAVLVAGVGSSQDRVTITKVK